MAMRLSRWQQASRRAHNRVAHQATAIQQVAFALRRIRPSSLALTVAASKLDGIAAELRQLDARQPARAND